MQKRKSQRVVVVLGGVLTQNPNQNAIGGKKSEHDK
jgi:hypothetical protein